MVPDCERPPSRSPWCPASCRAVMLGSQLAILMQNVEKLRYPSDNFLDGSFLTGHWINDSMAANPANAPSVRSTWLSRQLTIPLVVVLFLTIICLSVYFGCPHSCLMALSDRGHPSVSSSGPAVPIVIKEKSGRGVSATRFPRHPLPPNLDEKQSEEEEGDDTNSNVSAGPPDPRPPDHRIGLHSLPPEAVTNDPVDPISRPETSSAGPNATRR